MADLIEAFPPDTVWCESIATQELSDPCYQTEDIVSPDQESIRSIRLNLKLQNRQLKKQHRLLKKIERLLQDESSRLDTELVILSGFSKDLPRQKWQDYLPA
jgi:hypothetical protein